jgi:hypothetical protein
MTPTIACATLPEVLRQPALDGLRRARDAGTLDLDLEEQLRQLVLAASQDLEDRCSRWFLRREWTEVLDVVRDGQRLFHLRAFPASAPTSIKYAATGDFTGVTAWPTTDYAMVRAGRLGELRLRDAGPWLEAGDGVLEVTYTGGLATMVHQLPADLRMAVAEQVAFCWKRTQSIEVSSLSQDQGSVTYFRNGEGTPTFAKAVTRYRMMAVS